MRISESAKAAIDSLPWDEVVYEVNLGTSSRFQRDKFAYLKARYVRENEARRTMSFDDLMNDSVQIEKGNGTVLGPFKAVVNGNKAQVALEEALIDDGDVLVRELPEGREQRYVIEDADYIKSPEEFSIASFYRLRLRKEGKQEAASSTNYNVNIQSIQGPAVIGSSNVQQVQMTIEAMVNHIDSAQASESQKDEAKSLLRKVLEHPIFAGVAAGATLSGLGL